MPAFAAIGIEDVNLKIRDPAIGGSNFAIAMPSLRRRNDDYKRAGQVSEGR
jgi:hypothetical protein